jgi:hypothetical protein
MQKAMPNRTDFIEGLAVARDRLNALSPEQAFALGEVIASYRGSQSVPSGTLASVRSLWEGQPDRNRPAEKFEAGYSLPVGVYGAAIGATIEDDRGAFWVGNGEYESRVNFCPVTGRKAPRQMVEKPRWYPNPPPDGSVRMVWCDQDDTVPSSREEWRMHGSSGPTVDDPTPPANKPRS